MGMVPSMPKIADWVHLSRSALVSPRHTATSRVSFQKDPLLPRSGQIAGKPLGEWHQRKVQNNDQDRGLPPEVVALLHYAASKLQCENSHRHLWHHCQLGLPSCQVNFPEWPGTTRIVHPRR